MITRPLLAATCEDVHSVNFPVIATPKIDGIRAVKVGGKLVSRSFKPIPNRFIRETLEAILPDGMDGELLVGKTFQECTSAVMSRNGEPNFTYMIFDYVADSLNKPYKHRIQDYELWYEQYAEDHKNIDYVIPRYINNPAELFEYEKNVLRKKYEGVMIRDPNGVYKCGRSTAKQGILLKIKRFMDGEAIVIGFEELMHNENIQEADEFGLAERSSCKAGLVPAGMLGSLLVRDTKTGIEFNVGSGFTNEERMNIWRNHSLFLGRMIKYKSFEIGVKNAPRHPIYLGFRHGDDL